MRMLRVHTRIAPGLHGIGLFAAEPITADTVIWRYDPGMDFEIVLDAPLVDGPMPESLRRFALHYGYAAIGTHGENRYIICADDARFMNHSATANTRDDNGVTIACRDIAEGEEITCDYLEFCDPGDTVEQPSQIRFITGSTHSA